MNQKFAGALNEIMQADEQEIARLRAEVERLRAALRGMVNAFAYNAEQTVSTDGIDALQSDVKRALQVLGCIMPEEQARAALSKSKEVQP